VLRSTATGRALHRSGGLVSDDTVHAAP